MCLASAFLALCAIVTPPLARADVTVSSPLDGTTVSGSVLFSATDSRSPKYVDFTVDGGWTYRDTTAPYGYGSDSHFDTTKLTNGSHTFTARSTYRNGKQTTTKSSSVYVDNSAPASLSVALTSPADGGTVNAGPVTLNANAGGPVKFVEFWADGVKLGTDSTAPYTQSWDASSLSGSHAVAAVANDGSGVDGTFDAHRISDTSNVTVSGGTSSPSPAPGAPSSTGQVLWSADYAQRGFGNYASSYNAGMGQIVDDPVLGSARKVAKLTSSDSTLDGGNVRVQFASPGVINPGDEAWIGTSYLFPSDFPSRVDSAFSGFAWGDLGDIHGPPFQGSPMVELNITAPGDGRARLGWSRTTPYADWGWVGPYIDDVRGKWVDIVIHTKYSTSSDGFVEIWMNTGSGWQKQQLKGGVDRLYGITCGSGDAGGANYHKISHYWPKGLWGNRSVTSYFADHKIGTGFTAVEPHSYG